MAVAEVGPHRRELDRPGQQVSLLADVGDSVLGECGQGAVDLRALALELGRQVGGVEGGSPRDLLPAPDHRSAIDRDRVAVLEDLEEICAGDVDEADSGPGDQQRAGVRIAVVGGSARR